MAQSLPSSKHFTLEQLADGVYAAIATDDGNAASNGGFVDLGDMTIVVDSFMSPLAAADLRVAAEETAGRPVTFLFNTHWHLDHVFGNQVYGPETTIISTGKTRETMAERIPEMYEQNAASAPQQLAAMQEQIDAAENEAIREELIAQYERLNELVDSLAGFELRLPTLTFESNLTIHGSEHEAVLFTIGGGHTESDAMLHLPDADIAFVADLLFNQRHPWAGAGDPHEWIRILLTLEEILSDDTIIPGHGPLGTIESLIHERQYLSEIERIAYQLVRNGATAEDARDVAVPSAYQSWGGGVTFQRNMEFFFNRLTG